MLANLTRVRVGNGILGDLVWAGDLANKFSGQSSLRTPGGGNLSWFPLRLGAEIWFSAQRAERGKELREVKGWAKGREGEKAKGLGSLRFSF